MARKLTEEEKAIKEQYPHVKDEEIRQLSPVLTGKPPIEQRRDFRMGLDGAENRMGILGWTVFNRIVRKFQIPHIYVHATRREFSARDIDQALEQYPELQEEVWENLGRIEGIRKENEERQAKRAKSHGQYMRRRSR